MNLNELTLEETEKLQEYIISKIGKKDPIQVLFKDLKEGKLKTKNVDTDVLDFIFDGLTFIVERWIKEERYQIKDEKEKKIEPIDFEEGIRIIQNDRQFRRTIQKIRHMSDHKRSFLQGDHDLEHTQRVLLNASVLMSMRRELTDREREIVLTAIEYHDQGRIHDWEDDEHGKRFVQQITNQLDEYTPEEQNLIKFVIEQHCKSKKDNESAIQLVDENLQERYKMFLNYVKDADKLDRVRFLLGQDSLDSSRLSFLESKCLVEFAKQSLLRFHEITKYIGIKTIKDLFRRDKIFAQGEAQEELAQSVNKILKDNGYPQRSENIRLENVEPLQEKFIKGDYIYLLRGGRREQMSGFYSYLYCTEKMNLEEYCKQNPQRTPDQIADVHSSTNGKEWFISTTTNLPVTSSYARFNKTINGEESGSVYIIKIKKQYVQKMKPITLDGIIPIKGMDLNEDEYLIPDYVSAEELVKEFEFDNYEEIYRYLTQEIGLSISPEDIGFDGPISETSQKILEKARIDRILEEKVNERYEKNPDIRFGSQKLKKFLKETDVWNR